MLVLLRLPALLVAQFVNLGLLWALPGLGVIFLAWGLSVRQVRLLIPGGILPGLGAGARVGLSNPGRLMVPFEGKNDAVLLTAKAIKRTAWSFLLGQSQERPSASEGGTGWAVRCRSCFR